MGEKIPRTLDCPSCGAPLDYDGKSATVRCKFCKHVTLIDEAKEDKPDEVIFEEVRAPSTIPSRPVVIEAAPVAKGTAGLLGFGITAAILLVIGAVVGFALIQPGGPFIPSLGAMDPAILLPAENDAPPDVASLFYNSTDDNRLVARIRTANSKAVWKTDPLPGDGLADAMLADGTHVYVASKMDLFAYNGEDGSLAWQVEMPDRIEYDEDSFILAAGYVVAMTIDRSLQAYDASTGQLSWSRRLAGYDREIRQMDGKLVVMDTLGDDYTYSLLFLDPATGEEKATLTPSCQVREYSSETLDPSGSILYEPGQNSLFLFYDSFDGCIQRITLSTGQVTWQAMVEDGFSFSPYGFNSLITDAEIYLQNDGQLLSIDKATGTVKTLLTDEDYQFVPLAVSGNTLLVRAMRTRGTERFELWGVDPVTGEQDWTLDLENSTPIDPPEELIGLIDSDESGWSWHLGPSGLLLLEFRAEPNQLVLTLINPSDGSSQSEQTIEMKKVTGDFFSAPTIIGWWGEVVYFILDTNVYALDTTTGEILSSFQ